MTTQSTPPFAAQRLIFLALLLGMTMFAVVVAVVLQTNDGKGMLDPEPMEILNLASMIVGATMALGAFLVRGMIGSKAEAAGGDERAHLRFISRLVAVAMLEGGCLFGLTVWLLNGEAVPPLVVALVCLAIAIAIVPFSDPDAGVR